MRLGPPSDDVPAFDPIFVSGPRAVYAELTPDAEIVDTDGSFADNLRASLEAFERRCGGDGPLVFTTCDIVPDVDELRDALSDLDRHWPVDFWMPQIRLRPRRGLGTSSWKPTYRLRPRGGDEPVPMLPSHFILGWPRGVRVDFVLRLFEFLYRTRNRSVGRRFVAIAWRLIPQLLRHQPVALAAALRHLPPLVLSLARGTASAAEMERRLRLTLLTRRWRREHPERRGYVPMIDALSLARDIDTAEEAREISDLVV